MFGNENRWSWRRPVGSDIDKAQAQIPLKGSLLIIFGSVILILGLVKLLKGIIIGEASLIPAVLVLIGIVVFSGVFIYLGLLSVKMEKAIREGNFQVVDCMVVYINGESVNSENESSTYKNWVKVTVNGEKLDRCFAVTVSDMYSFRKLLPYNALLAKVGKKYYVLL